MKSFKMLQIVGIAIVTFGAQDAYAKTARCDLRLSESSYRGPCLFEAGEKGSFELTRIADGAILERYETLTVDVLSPGVAFVAGWWLSIENGDGRNNRIGLGDVRRSTKDKACWIGSENNLKICVY